MPKLIANITHKKGEPPSKVAARPCPFISRASKAETKASEPPTAAQQYLRPCIGHIQVMQGHILYDFLLLVNISLWQRDILFSFKVKFCGIGVTPTLPL